jgi:uncharacterized membrane protein
MFQKTVMTVALVVGFLGMSTQVEAAFNLCNYSSKIVDVAFALEHPQQKGNWISAGWKRLNSGTCQTLINYDLTKINQNVYFYGLSVDGQTSYAGRQNFCVVRGQPFTVFNADRNCNGGEFLPFVQVSTGYKKDYSHNITD